MEMRANTSREEGIAARAAALLQQPRVDRGPTDPLGSPGERVIEPAVSMRRSSSTLFENSVFEPGTADDDATDGINSELQAARLRLEAVERERDAIAEHAGRLSAELSATQSRLHDALECLQGVLAERTALLQQTHDLQDQLEAAWLDQRNAQHARPRASSADGTPQATPQRQLRQELLLAQAQLSELRQQQLAWEGERQQLLVEVEEERQRLQEGLAQALTQANCAQRDADAAAERASHWCSLAQLLQRSALLPEGSIPASPASIASLYSPGGSALKRSVLKGRSGSKDGCGLLPPAGLQSPGLLLKQQTSDSNSSGGSGNSAEGAGLIGAFHAAASSAEVPKGSPLLRAQSQSQRRPKGSCSPVGMGQLAPAGSVGSELVAAICPSDADLRASAELAPGTRLQLVNKLPAPGLSMGSSSHSGHMQSPLTPPLLPAALGKVGMPAGGFGSMLSAGSHRMPSASTGDEQQSASPVTTMQSRTPAGAADRSRGRARAASRQQQEGRPQGGGFLHKLLLRAACAGGLAVKHEAWDSPVSAAGMR